VEGRDMPAVHITASTNKKRLYFQCQIHASVSSSTHAVTHLLLCQSY